MTASEKAVSTARAWIGRRESDGSFKTIIDTYNSISPLPRGYRMTYSDPWCAAFVSAVGARCGLSDIILPECGCEPMIQLYKNAGRWVEDDSYKPQPGDIVFYDWQDTGNGDNTGSSDHVGIVADVNDTTFTVIEGNKSDAVGTRTMRINGQYIRGFGIPDYGEEKQDEPAEPAIPAPQYHGYVYAVLVNLLKPGNKGPQVWNVQQLLNAHGFECEINGVYDTATTKAVKAFQKAAGIEQDGEFGGESFAKLWNWRQT